MTSAASPAEGNEAPSRPWKGDGELGVVVTSGNTDIRSVNANFSLLNEREKWRQSGQAETLYTSEKGETAAHRFKLFAKSAYKLREVDYLFVTAEYEDDRFSGYDYRTIESIGYGRRLVQNDVTLDVEAGPGFRHSERNEGQTENDLLLRVAGKLDWKLSESVLISEDLSVETGRKGTVTRLITSLKTKIVGNLAMKLSHDLQHNSQAPAGTEEINTRTAVTFVYSF